MLIQIADFGLVVLIWIVQLVIYPGFKYYRDEDLSRWHSTYTRNVTWIVLPLMAGQLGIHLYEIIGQFTTMRLVVLLMILIVWLNTFFYAVPLHQRISDNDDISGACKALTRVNWYRTMLWTLVFVIGLFVY